MTQLPTASPERGVLQFMPSALEGKDHRGDGTVPRPSAMPHRLGESHRAAYFVEAHGSLQNNTAVMDHVAAVISADDIDWRNYMSHRDQAGLSLEMEEGTRNALIGELENPSEQPVQMLYFAGHGAVNPDTSTALIKLENGEELTAAEVDRREVMLGRRHGPMVSLSACAVATPGREFGQVDGWPSLLWPEVLAPFSHRCGPSKRTTHRR